MSVGGVITGIFGWAGLLHGLASEQAWYLVHGDLPGARSMGMYLELWFVRVGLALESVVRHLGPGSAWVDLILVHRYQPNEGTAGMGLASGFLGASLVLG